MAFGALKGTLTGASTSVTNPTDATGSSIGVVAGDLIVSVMAESTALTASSVTDNIGNTYTAQNAGTLTSGIAGRMFYSFVVTSAANLTTSHFAATASTDKCSVVTAVYTGPFASSIDKNPANLAGDLISPFTANATGGLSYQSETVIGWAARTTSATLTGTTVTVNASSSDSSSITTAVIASVVVSNSTSVAPNYTGTTPTGSLLGTASFYQSGAIPSMPSFPGAGQSRYELPPSPPFSSQDSKFRRNWEWKYNQNLIGKDKLPTRQQDWPVPPRVIWYRDWSAQAQVVPSPFFQTDWPISRDPRDKRSWEWWYNLNLIGADQLPNRQQYWPNPYPVQWYQYWSNVGAPGGFPVPFNQLDWPNPRDPRDKRSWEWQYNLNLIGQDVITVGTVYTDRPPPVQWYRSWEYTYNPNLIGQDQLPNRQQDWPNPREFRRYVDWVYFNSLAINNSLGIPFSQLDWPNPRGYPRPDGTYVSYESLALITPPVKPFFQSDWPNPYPVQWYREWNATYNKNLIGQDQFPIRQQDWPLPNNIPQYWDKNWFQTLELLFVPPPDSTHQPLPFDWGYQEKLQWYRDWAYNTTILLPPGVVRLPFNQFDWPLPGNVLAPGNTWYRDWFQNLQETTLRTSAVPLNQFDWPIPYRVFWYPAFNQNIILLFPPPPPPPIVTPIGGGRVPKDYPHTWTWDNVEVPPAYRGVWKNEFKGQAQEISEAAARLGRKGGIASGISRRR